MHEYPHLTDTSYPDLDTVDVYKIENKFDYQRWGIGTQIKLCNVLYNADYSDVCKFDNDQERDRYFDSIDGQIATLQTAFHQAPRDYIKVPIPYDSAIRYNYCFIDIPIPTSSTQPIDDVAANRIKRFYYFIADVEQLAPSTTKVSVTLDVWTTYINDVSIPYLMLERGHAPVSVTNARTYLSNPMKHNRYLLAPDENYGEIGVTVSNDFKPIGNGSKLVVFFTTYSYNQLSAIEGGTDLATGTAATYTDASGRAGYKMNVSDYAYGMGGVDFSDVSIPVQAYNVDYNADVPSLYAYAIACENARAFFDLMSRRYPHFLQTVQACTVLGSDVINIYDPLVIGSYTIYKTNPRTIAINIDLIPEDFNYPAEFARFAKLYTYPYCILEISDNNGSTFTIRVEDCTNDSALKATLALAYPYMNLQIYADQVAGTGSNSYAWAHIDGTSSDVAQPVNDFAAFMIQWDIPTYALFERGYDAYRLSHFWDMQLTRANAITAYQSAQRSANISDANTHDTNSTNVTNTANSNTTMRANVALANTASTANVLEKARIAVVQQNFNEDASYDNLEADFALMYDTLVAEQDLARTQNLTSQFSSGVNAVAGAFSAAATGNVAGAVMSVGSGITNAITTQVNYAAQVQCDNTLYAAQVVNSDARNTIGLELAINQISQAGALAQTVNTTTNNANTSQATNNANTSNTNANNTANTSNANADYTRNGLQLNNAATMETARRNEIYGYRTHELDAQQQIGSFAGDAGLDARQRRGISIRIKTQRDSDIAQVAAQFARFGYRLNQVWDTASGLCLMRNFTYWKASDIWVKDDKGTPNAVQLTIADIFRSGVTIWNNPEKIGSVSVYDN